MKLPILILILILTFVALPSAANDCSVAMDTIDEIVLKANSALNVSDIDEISEVASNIKLDADKALQAADGCDCDDAYYTAEVILETAHNAYLSDSVEEATGYIKTVQKEVAAAKKHVQTCATLLAKQ